MCRVLPKHAPPSTDLWGHSHSRKWVCVIYWFNFNTLFLCVNTERLRVGLFRPWKTTLRMDLLQTQSLNLSFLFFISFSTSWRRKDTEPCLKDVFEFTFNIINFKGINMFISCAVKDVPSDQVNNIQIILRPLEVYKFKN